MENQVNQNDQTELITSTEQKKEDSSTNKIKKYSFLGIITTFILVIIIIMLGSRVIFDANRMLNPVIDQSYTESKNNQKNGSMENIYSSNEIDMSVDISSGPFSSTKVYYPKAEESRYSMYQLIIHAAIIIPLFILIFVLFYFKKENYAWRPIVVGFLVAGFWLILRLLGETMTFVMDAYKNIAIYIILIILALLFGGLTLYVQSRHIKEKN